jgi:hypothetical protein
VLEAAEMYTLVKLPELLHDLKFVQINLTSVVHAVIAAFGNLELRP